MKSGSRGNRDLACAATPCPAPTASLNEERLPREPRPARLDDLGPPVPPGLNEERLPREPRPPRVPSRSRRVLPRLNEERLPREPRRGHVSLPVAASSLNEERLPREPRPTGPEGIRYPCQTSMKSGSRGNRASLRPGHRGDRRRGPARRASGIHVRPQ